MKSDLRKKKAKKNLGDLPCKVYFIQFVGLITCLHTCSIVDSERKHLLDENQQLPCAALHVPAAQFGYTTAPSAVLELQRSLGVQTFHFTILY